MKSKDIRTIKSLISEYGMNSGVSTPSSQQQTGSTAKATAAQKPQKSSVNKPQNSPSSQQKSQIFIRLVGVSINLKAELKD